MCSLAGSAPSRVSPESPTPSRWWVGRSTPTPSWWLGGGGGRQPFPQSNRAVPYSPHLGGERAGLRPDSCHFAKAFSPHHSSIALGQSDDDLGGFPGRSASEGTNLGDFAQRPAHRVSSCEIRWNVRRVQLVEATLPQELNLQRLSSPIFCW